MFFKLTIHSKKNCFSEQIPIILFPIILLVSIRVYNLLFYFKIDHGTKSVTFRQKDQEPEVAKLKPNLRFWLTGPCYSLKVPVHNLLNFQQKFNSHV